MSRTDLWKSFLIGIAISLAPMAQQHSAKIEFEVVSVKPADPSAPGHMSQVTPGGFRGQNLRLFELIMTGWRVNRDQIVGGPNWMDTAGWDIDARFPAGASHSQFPQMIQAMLADRFGLVHHRETRVLPVYELTVAKSGVKLHAGGGQGGMSAGPRLIRYDSGTMGQLASQLSSYLGHEVIDRTGLTGQYAINLSFAPVDPGGAADGASDPAPSIFQALQDQAGLKLESTKGPVEVLVIDRAEKPTSN
jgi:uncharacterized protein (TIGR03435 family)